MESGRPRTGPAGCRVEIAVGVCSLWGPILTSSLLQALKWAFLGALGFVEPAFPTQLLSAVPLESRAVAVVPRVPAVETAPPRPERQSSSHPGPLVPREPAELLAGPGVGQEPETDCRSSSRL